MVPSASPSDNSHFKVFLQGASVLLGGLAGVAIAIYSFPAAAQTQSQATCQAALDRMQSYQTVSGDTLASIAAANQLLPVTLSRFNPGISSSPPAGTTVLIPPFNGTATSASASATWRSLAEQYGSRADILFEVNGCVSQVPSRVFIPGGLTVASSSSQVSLPGYPLSQRTPIALSYGWQPHATRDELVFNSGIAFSVTAPADVLSVDSGTVAFAGEQAGYGNLVVINHSQGLQTRYANLSEVSVAVGQSVAAEGSVGRVGGDAPTYLYFEVRKNSSSGWVAEDPARYLPALELR